MKLSKKQIIKKLQDLKKVEGIFFNDKYNNDILVQGVQDSNNHIRIIFCNENEEEEIIFDDKFQDKNYKEILNIISNYLFQILEVRN